MNHYYLTQDLFFSSHVTFQAEKLGIPLQVVSSVEKLLAFQGTTGLVLIDLSLAKFQPATDLARLREIWPTARFVGYAPHVHESLMHEARQAGCEEVLTRGQFHAHMERVLKTYAGQRAGSDSDSVNAPGA
jgi:DNA-binding NarL/FixJ family response regulator